MLRNLIIKINSFPKDYKKSKVAPKAWKGKNKVFETEVTLAKCNDTMHQTIDYSGS